MAQRSICRELLTIQQLWIYTILDNTGIVRGFQCVTPSQRRLNAKLATITKPDYWVGCRLYAAGFECFQSSLSLSGWWFAQFTLVIGFIIRNWNIIVGFGVGWSMLVSCQSMYWWENMVPLLLSANTLWFIDIWCLCYIYPSKCPALLCNFIILPFLNLCLGCISRQTFPSGDASILLPGLPLNLMNNHQRWHPAGFIYIYME